MTHANMTLKTLAWCTATATCTTTENNMSKKKEQKKDIEYNAYFKIKHKKCSKTDR